MKQGALKKLLGASRKIAAWFDKIFAVKIPIEVKPDPTAQRAKEALMKALMEGGRRRDIKGL